MYSKKEKKLKEGFSTYDSLISIILYYVLIGIIIKWYSNCKYIITPVFLWPYLIIDYIFQKLESDTPPKFCY